MNTNTKAIIATCAGVALSIVVLIVKFLTGNFLSADLAALIITCINTIAQGFNLVIINTQQQTIASMSRESMEHGNIK